MSQSFKRRCRMCGGEMVHNPFCSEAFAETRLVGLDDPLNRMVPPVPRPDETTALIGKFFEMLAE